MSDERGSDVEFNTALYDLFVGRGGAAAALGAYILSATYLSRRARLTGRRDLDFTLDELERDAEEDLYTEAEATRLVQYELWQPLGGRRYRLLGLNRLVRIPALSITPSRRRRRKEDPR